jgi:hypothetical protein
MSTVADRVRHVLYQVSHRQGVPVDSIFRTGRPYRRFLALATAGSIIASLFVFSTGVFAAPPSGDLDQCANGGVDKPAEQCTGAAWVNGNLNGSKAHYLEDQAIPYRLRFANLNTNPSFDHTVTIEWDTTKSGKHALDYLVGYDYTEAVAPTVPCSAALPGFDGCDATNFDTLLISIDPKVTAGQNGVDDAPAGPTGGDDIAQDSPEFLTLFGDTGTTVDLLTMSSYSVSGSYAGDSSTRTTITFRTTDNDPVLAWSGHIAARIDWGTANSAVAIPGSPYHTRLIDIDGKGGNQDRSLSSDAVLFPASLTIIKDTVPNAATDFAFTTTGDLSPSSFSLDDDAEGTLSNQQAYSITTFGAANTKTVTETDPGSSYLTTVACTEDSGGLPQTDNSTTSNATRTATIIAEEAEIIVCTFTNTFQKANPSGASAPTLIPQDKVTVSSLDTTGAVDGAADKVMTVSLWSDATCSASSGPLYSEQFTVTANTTYATQNDGDPTDATATPADTIAGYTITADGTYKWKVVYNGDSKNNGFTLACGAEQVVVDVTPNPAP